MEAASEKNKKIEMKLLISMVKEKYGYDFTHYTLDLLEKRLDSLKERKGLDHLSDLIPLGIWDEDFFHEILLQLTIGVTEFFRDPEFYKSFVEKVVPNLTTFPYVKIWHAGCSTGEEAYSMAMLLQEQSLLEQAIIYGTDINSKGLSSATQGVYELDKIDQCGQNYKEVFGNVFDAEKFFQINYQKGKVHNDLMEHITFSQHNLVQDSVFGEMNVICCRNVLIYFSEELQNQVLSLIDKSLRPGGYLCLGTGESLFLSVLSDGYEVVDRKQRIYRKKICEVEKE